MKKYHAFICYNSVDIEFVENLYDYLTNAHLNIFFDKKSIQLGALHSREIESALNSINIVLVCIGPNGRGPWQDEEIYQAIWESVKHKTILIPIVLPDASINSSSVPGWLKSRSACIFKKQNDIERIQELIDKLVSSNLIEDTKAFEKPLSSTENEAILSNTIKFYNTHSTEFYEKWSTNIPEEKFDLFCQHLDKSAKILDAGCGPGHHIKWFEDNGYTINGIDLSKKAIELAHKHNLASPIIEMDMRDTQFDRNTFDAIWSCASCVHCDDDYFPNQLREFNRIVKPGGILGITLMVGNVSAIEEDGRFFQGYKNADEFVKILMDNDLELLDMKTNLLEKNTHEIKKVSNWCLCVARTTPIRKKIFNKLHNKAN